MKKKIITRTTFFKRAKSYQKKLSIDKKVKKISRQLYILSDQHNWSYQHSWMGEPMLQTPEDVIKMEKIIFEHKPKIIFEIGVCWGGMLLFYDNIAKSHDIEKILGVDIFVPKNLRLRLKGKVSKKVILKQFSSIDEKYLNYYKRIKGKKKVLIHLDSNHTQDHVLSELRLFDKVTKKGDIIIVGDTIINYIPNQKHRIREWNNKRNPKTALDIFFKENKKYKLITDYSENSLLTNNPYSHIIKIRD